MRKLHVVEKFYIHLHEQIKYTVHFSFHDNVLSPCAFDADNMLTQKQTTGVMSTNSTLETLYIDTPKLL